MSRRACAKMDSEYCDKNSCGLGDGGSYIGIKAHNLKSKLIDFDYRFNFSHQQVYLFYFQDICWRYFFSPL